MCTISFLPQADGYAIAMNRDEKRARIEGQAPKVRHLNGRRVLSPSEPGGGTWIAVNDKGVTLGLVNWYAVARKVGSEPVSRGVIVASAAGFSASKSVSRFLGTFPLSRVNPFRLVGIFPEECAVVEWRWDLTELVSEPKDWIAQQWISSGFDELTAQKQRSDAFQRAWSQRAAGSLPWLRRLHQSHSPCRGPFSTCMHRRDAASVSYTEIRVSPRVATMRYGPGNPCEAGECSRGQPSLERKVYILSRL